MALPDIAIKQIHFKTYPSIKQRINFFYYKVFHAGLFSPFVIFALLHPQTICPCLQFAYLRNLKKGGTANGTKTKRGRIYPCVQYIATHSVEYY